MSPEFKRETSRPCAINVGAAPGKEKALDELAPDPALAKMTAFSEAARTRGIKGSHAIPFDRVR